MELNPEPAKDVRLPVQMFTFIQRTGNVQLASKEHIEKVQKRYMYNNNNCTLTTTYMYKNHEQLNWSTTNSTEKMQKKNVLA